MNIGGDLTPYKTGWYGIAQIEKELNKGSVGQRYNKCYDR